MLLRAGSQPVEFMTNTPAQQSGPDSRVIAVGGPVSGVAVWIIALSLLAIAVLLAVRLGAEPGGQVFAQPVSQAGARGVFAFSGQLSKNAYGLYMVDVDAATIWCYEFVPTTKRLRLVSGRSWEYDRFLRNFNQETPDYKEVERLVEQERQQVQPDEGP